MEEGNANPEAAARRHLLRALRSQACGDWPASEEAASQAARLCPQLPAVRAPPGVAACSDPCPDAWMH